MIDWMGEPVLVTGAGGFIGSHLVEELVRRGATVRALVRYNARGSWGSLETLPSEVIRNVDVVSGDVRDPYFVDQIARGMSFIFHLASLIAVPYSQVAPESFIQTNILGTVNVLEASRRHGIEKLVQTSTSEVYGTARYTPIDENHPLQAFSPYAASKIGADKVVESYWRSFNLPVTVVRPFNAYGPRQSARAIIPAIACQAMKRPSIELGALSPVRDFTYVSDLVAAFLSAAKAPGSTGEVLNIGTRSGVSMGELAAQIQRILGTDLPVTLGKERVRPYSSEVETLICDSAKAQRLLAWKPAVSFEEGLQKVLQWIEAHPESYKPDRYSM